MQRIVILLVMLFVSACAPTATNHNISSINPLVDRDNMGAASLLNIADDLYSNKNYTSAYAIYAKAEVEAETTSFKTQALQGQAFSLLRMGMHEQALDGLLKLKNLGTYNAKLEEALAEANFFLANFSEAQKIIVGLENNNDSSDRFYTIRGLLHEINLEHELARQDYESVLSLEGINSAIFTNLALSYALTSDFDLAETLLLGMDYRAEDLGLVYALKGEMLKAEEVITEDFHRRGLDASHIAQNMAFYEKLKDLSQKARVRAVVLGKITEPSVGD